MGPLSQGYGNIHSSIKSCPCSALLNLFNLFLDSQLHATGYTQHWCSTEMGSDSRPWLWSESRQRSQLFFSSFLPVMASDHNYYRAFSKNRCVYNLLALWLSAWTCWQCAGPKLHSLLSTHSLIGACVLSTESDKHMGFPAKYNEQEPWKPPPHLLHSY